MHHLTRTAFVIGTVEVLLSLRNLPPHRSMRKVEQIHVFPDLAPRLDCYSMIEQSDRIVYFFVTCTYRDHPEHTTTSGKNCTLLPSMFATSKEKMSYMRLHS